MSSLERRDGFISLIGAILVLSPAGNLLWSSYWTHSTIWFYPEYLIEYAKHLSPLIIFLWFSFFLTGLFMLGGKKSTLDFALFVLVIAVIFGLLTFNRYSDAKKMQAIISILLNVGLLILVSVLRFQKNRYSPLPVTRPSSPQPTAPLSTALPPAVALKKEVLKFNCDFITVVKINFPGFPESLVLKKITELGFEADLIHSFPAEHLINKKVKVKFWQSPLLGATIYKQDRHKIIFRFLANQDINGLRQELTRMSIISQNA